MNRREFVGSASSLLGAVMMNGVGVKSFAASSGIVNSIRKSNLVDNDKVLVIVYMSGGNDGLNTVIPLDQYSQYYSLRSNIAIPEGRVLRLNNSPEVGFHPSLTGFRDLYNEGKLAIINGVAYPNPTLSHVRSTDIWMTGTDADRIESSGWIGRGLMAKFPGFPSGYPNSSMEDPLAIQIGTMGSTLFLGNSVSTAINLENPDTFNQLIGKGSADINNDLPCSGCDAGDLISYIKQQQVLSIGYASEIKAAADLGQNLATYPAGIGFAERLKIIAKLIHGGLKSKVYYVEIGGFDTHGSQVGSTSTDGIHAQLLKYLSDSIFAFQQDLNLLGVEDMVVGMTFSDFGRRATSNASKGTDHGVAAPMFLFGTGIKRRVVGTNPDLTNGLLPSNPAPGDSGRDIKMQIDFRRVYADVLNDWFGASPSSTDQVLFRNFKTTSLFSDTVQTLSSGAWINPEIWSNGRVPSAADIIQVNAGHVIEVGQNITAKNIQVAGGGELKFLGNYAVNITG